VRDLSGGEKGRLALAKLIYSRVNVLVLDEPTNHLDIPSRESLEEALDAYEGTIITISHDRYFLDRVATQILALDGAGGAEHYDGDYTEYHDWKLTQRPAKNSAAVAPAPAPETRQNSATSKNEAKEKKAGGKNAKKNSGKMVRDAAVIEAEIGEVEAQLAVISEQLGQESVVRDKEKLLALNREYKIADERLGALYAEWEGVAQTTANA
jgi:ATP-binding cassette subfamily F protein 3